MSNRKKTRAAALPESEAVWIMLNEVFPSDRMPQSSPSRYACFAGRADRAAAMKGYLCVQSRPVRVNNWALPCSRRGVHAVAVILDLMTFHYATLGSIRLGSLFLTFPTRGLTGQQVSSSD